MFKFRLFPMFEVDGDIGAESGVSSEVVAEPSTSIESNEPVTTGGTTPDAEGNKVNEAFAKRLSAEKAKIEKEYQEKYKDYDTYKEVGEYFREANQMDNVLTLKEQIEMQRLQARAEQAEIPVEVQKRLEELESRAAKGDELAQNQAVQDFYNKFKSDLDKFVEGKDVKGEDVEKFMIDNQIKDMKIAYQAMKFEDTQAQKEAIKKEAIAEYLASKKSGKVEGSGTAGHVMPDAPKTMAEANKRALEMIRAAKQKQ